MTHNHLYTFAIEKGRVLQFKNNIQIARLHSFSYTPINYSTIGITTLYENLLACSNHDGNLVVIDIFTRRKRIIKIPKTEITTLVFLNNTTLVSTTIDELVKVHNLKTLGSINIIEPLLVALLKNKPVLNLEDISCSLLTPLIAKSSFELIFELMFSNPWLSETIEYQNMENLYRSAFEKSIEALCNNNRNKANKLLEIFKNVKSKKTEIKMLFHDFKHLQRFQQHIFEKKYSIAYAISSKHTNLQLTSQYKKMETVYQNSFKLAQNQILIGKIEEARESLKEYITTLSKRDEILELLKTKSTNSNLTEEKKLSLAYEKSDFKKCYELIDTYSIDNIKLVVMLEKHWIKSMLRCEDYALHGNIKNIKTTLGELMGVTTRSDKVGDLLRVAFHSKIKTFLTDKKFTSAENIIYSYIDLFGGDIEIKDIMKQFEKESSKKLAITHNQNEQVLRKNWLHAEIIMEN